MIKLKKLLKPKPQDISTKNRLFIHEMARLKAYFKLDTVERARTRPPFNKDVLFTISVLEELKRIQRSKCAYCETSLEGRADLYLSHYRPRSNAIDPRNNIEHTECYAWFSYEWQNLMLICNDCSSRKLNYFPKSGRTAKVFSSWKNAQVQEQPLLLNPFEDDPLTHLLFDTEGFVSHGSERGKVTIELLDLNRISLCINRKKSIFEVLTLILMNDKDELIASLQKYTNGHYPHAGAIRNCLGHVCRILQADMGPSRYSPHMDPIQTVIRLKNEYSSNSWQEAITRCKANRLEFSIRNTILSDFSLPKRYEYISKIEIDRFKGVENFALDLGGVNLGSKTPCTMLLGENATGKSSILQAIALTLMPPEDRRRVPIDRQSIVPHMLDENDTAQIQVKVSVHFRNGEHISLILDKHTDRFRTIGNQLNQVFGYGSRRYFLSGQLNKNKSCPSKTLFNHAASLPDPTLWLLDIAEEKFNAVARALASLLTLRNGEFVSRNDYSIFIQRRTSTLPIEHLSDGYKSLFAMAVDIMRELLEHWGNLEYAQGIVVIDEIENHLHPRWKMRVMSALREAFPSVQFIASTHDPLCLRGMFDGEVQVLYRDLEGYLQHVEHLPNIATLRIEQILTSDYFGLATTEDPLRQHALETLAQYAKHEDKDLSPQDRKHRDELLESYGSLPIIGDTLDRQIIAQALTRHIRETSLATPIEKADAREASVRAIIEVLERNRRMYGTR